MEIIPPPNADQMHIGHLKGIAESFGFEPKLVRSILMEPTQVVVTCFTTPKSGATVTHRIPVIP